MPTRVVYPEGGISHFKLWRDNLQISWMHTRLFFGMLARLPLLLWRKLAGRSPSRDGAHWASIAESTSVNGIFSCCSCTVCWAAGHSASRLPGDLLQLAVAPRVAARLA